MRAVWFFNVSLQPKIIQSNITVMKKILFLIAATAMLSMAIASCGDDEPGRRDDGVFTVNTSMFNHIVNTGNGQVLGISATHNKLVIDTIRHTASLELTYNDGSEHTVKLDGIKATPKRLGFYALSGSGSQVKDLTGYVDFNEGAMRYAYTTADGLRIVSMTPEVFYLKTTTTLTYDDTTKSNTVGDAMYQFDIMPGTNNCNIKVMQLTYAKEFKYFENITSNGVVFTVTPTGFTVSGTGLKTTATYRTMMDSTRHNIKTTDKYPFRTFSANVDIVNDTLVTNFTMGGATVVASGRTYPDYTAY